MRRAPSLFAVLATAAVAATAFAGDVAIKSQWDGFGEGSWVIQKTTSKSQMGEQPANEAVIESRQTLAKVAEKAYTVKSEQKIGEEWSGVDIEIPRVGPDSATVPPDTKVEDLGTEKLTVDGESIECKKRKVTMADNVTTSWTSEKYGQVKSEGKGPAGESSSALLKLKAVVKIKGKDVECRQTSTSWKSPQQESTTLLFSSDAIPGGTARMESTVKIPNVMTSTSVMEVTDFEKK